jgi:hypothetical protein
MFFVAYFRGYDSMAASVAMVERREAQLPF